MQDSCYQSPVFFGYELARKPRARESTASAAGEPRPSLEDYVRRKSGNPCPVCLLGKVGKCYISQYSAKIAVPLGVRTHRSTSMYCDRIFLHRSRTWLRTRRTAPEEFDWVGYIPSIGWATYAVQVSDHVVVHHRDGVSMTDVDRYFLYQAAAVTLKYQGGMNTCCFSNATVPTVTVGIFL